MRMMVCIEVGMQLVGELLDESVEWGIFGGLG